MTSLCFAGYCQAINANVLQQPVEMSLLTPIQSILNAPDKYLTSAVTIKGSVVAVCKKRGCWAEIATEQGNIIRVKVKDGETIIPMSSRGKKAFVSGMLTPLVLSQQQAILYLEHMAKDAGESFDRNSVKSGLTVYQLLATAIQIVEKS